MPQVAEEPKRALEIEDEDAPKPKRSKKAPKVDEILLKLVVDRSGSMGFVKHETIEAFNQYLADRRAEPGKTTTWLTLFNTSMFPLCTAAPIAECPALDEQNYRTSGGTALYRAIGEGILELDAWCQKKGYKGKVLFVIQTDGYENASGPEWPHSRVQAMITKYQESPYDWVFVFLGRDMDAWGVSNSLNIPTGNTVSYAGGQSVSTMDSLSTVTMAYRIPSLAKDSDFAKKSFMSLKDDNSVAAVNKPEAEPKKPVGRTRRSRK